MRAGSTLKPGRELQVASALPVRGSEAPPHLGTSITAAPPPGNYADAELNPYFGPDGHYTSLLALHSFRYHVDDYYYRPPPVIAPPPGFSDPQGAQPIRRSSISKGKQPVYRAAHMDSAAAPQSTASDRAGPSSSLGYIDESTVDAPQSTSKPPSRRAVLRQTASSFCAALLNPTEYPPSRLLSTFFTPSNPRITEHGPSWSRARLPFLAFTFRGAGKGKDSCEEYFKLLTETLRMHLGPDTFPPAGGFAVDEEGVVEREDGRGVVTVVSRVAEFEAVATGRRWKERFIYRLSGFDAEGRIGHWEVWADPLSAWDAVGGEAIGEGGGGAS